MAAKKFRVATEGATTDGRRIERVWLEQIARNYDPKTYGARVNMEHIKGFAPDSVFKRYGDVLSVSTEEIDGKLALFAVIDPTEELVALSKRRQKVYTSIEIAPEFADSGEAYLVGLAITDDPASLGTEMLSFCAQASSNPLGHRKQHSNNLFTEALPFSLELEEADKPAASLFGRVKELLSQRSKTDQARFDDLQQALEALASAWQEQAGQLNHNQQVLQQTRQDLHSLQSAHTELLQRLHNAPSSPPRAPATGGHAASLTDC